MTPSGNRDVVVIGGSAGAVEALGPLVSGLPADLPAALFIAVHMAPHSRSTLAAILNRRGPLPAAQAADHESIRPGRIYVATPDRHLLVERDRIRVTRGPRENGHRPAVDALFRSAAMSAGPRVVAVVLSGSLDDGAAGLASIKRCGGIGIVQADAAHPEMPNSARQATEVDHAVSLDQIPGLIQRRVTEHVDTFEPRQRLMLIADAPSQPTEPPAAETSFTCPDCGGSLWELEGEPLRYRCRVGHAYGARSLVSANSGSLEQALWTSLRAFEERSALLTRIATRFAERGNHRQAARFEEDAAALAQRADIVRSALLDADLVGAESASREESAERTS